MQGADIVMEKWMQAAIIIGVCVLVIFIVRFRKGALYFLNFLFRAVGGSVIIYLCNLVLAFFEISPQLGLNLFTVLTCGFLGIPGVAGLFCLRFFLFL